MHGNHRGMKNSPLRNTLRRCGSDYHKKTIELVEKPGCFKTAVCLFLPSI
jgi:hypothetical protein